MKIGRLSFLLTLILCPLVVPSITVAAGMGRTSEQVAADIDAARSKLSYYAFDDELNPIYRQQMTRELSGTLQQVVDLYNELEKVDPALAKSGRIHKCAAVVQLAIYGHDDATKILTDSADSTTPSESVFGHAGLMMYNWWNDADEATQQRIVGEFKDLAVANPTDNLLFGAALAMAEHRASTRELANSLRDIIEQDLKSPAADRYRHRPDKIGRPFKVVVKTLDGTYLSTANWKGKVVLIDFWATWCPPCRASIPGLAKLYAADHSRGLEVLGISNDSVHLDLVKFLDGQKEMVWPQSFSPEPPDGWNTLSHSMKVEGIPTTFLIDRNGILRDRAVCNIDEKLVEQLLNETVSPPAAPDASASASTASASVDEDKANALLSLANSYIANNLPDRARDKLNELVQKYPNTAAAPQARSLLANLGGQ